MQEMGNTLRTQWKTARRRGGGCTETPALRTQWKTAGRRGGGRTETPSGHSGRLPGEGEGAVRKHQPSGHSGRLPGEGEGAVQKHPQDTVEDCQEKGRGLYRNTLTAQDQSPHYSYTLDPLPPPAVHLLGHVAVHFSVSQVKFNGGGRHEKTRHTASCCSTPRTRTALDSVYS